ncbi:MAG: DUF881 domain-containing protein [Carbonactinosporaceae bacterium]
MVEQGTREERGERGEKAEPAARPDASMSLLNKIVEGALDAGYAQATERKVHRQDGRPGPRAAAAYGLRVFIVVLAGAMLATAWIEVRRDAPTNAREREALIARINETTADADQLQHRLDTLRIQVSRAQRGALAATAEGQGVAARLARLELATGAVPVTGPGVEVTVDDAETEDTVVGEQPSTEPFDPGRVLDTDLQRLVNGLWVSGAEAIAINGQRLTSTSAIRAAGRAILVDYRPLSPPYVVRAIGDPETLEVRFVDGPAGQTLRALEDNFGVRFDVVPQEQLVLPGASGIDVRQAEPAPQATEEGTR